jgi:DNA-binding CsgD family transcriptional regulator
MPPAVGDRFGIVQWRRGGRIVRMNYSFTTVRMSFSLGRTLGASVAGVAVLNALAGLSMPVPSRAPSAVLVGVWTALLLVHAGLYWFGDRIRARLGLRGYVVGQAIVLFAIATAQLPTPVTLAVFVACTAELVLLAGSGWGAARITAGAIVVFVLASLITSNLYRASAAGLVLAVTGLLAQAVAALVRRSPVAVVAGEASPARSVPTNLSDRELEVLRELASGRRNSDIARTLGITELTVKAHLRSIYQKLGVETRAAAVAIAIKRQLV